MQPGSLRHLTLPALDLKSELQHPYSVGQECTVKLFPNNKQLLQLKREIVVVQGTAISKKFTYEEDIITATYTTFSTNRDSDALVVCLRKLANIYYPDGRNYVVSLPFSLKNAFPFESGLILEKDQEQPNLSNNIDSYHPHQLNVAKFLTLIDPIGTFRIVTTSSTSVISPYEELMAFPRKGLNKVASLCVTYNTHDGNVILYHIRSSTRKTNRISSNNSTASLKTQKRKHSLLSTPNPSRVLDDEFEAGNNQNVMSLNMDKKRTSTLLSDISSIARMGSEPGFPEANKPSPTDFPNLRKDMILTQQDIIRVNVEKHNLQIYDLTYEDQEAIVVMNKKQKEARVYIFKQQFLSQLQNCYTIQCMSCLPLCNPKYDGLLVCLIDNHSVTLVNPFLDMASPKIDLASSFPLIKELVSSCEESVALKSFQGTTYILHLILEPSSDFVVNCLNCFKYLSGSKINEIIWMLWRSALVLDDSKNDWNAFVIALLSIIYPFQSNDEYLLNSITKLLPKAKYLHSTLNFSYSFSDLIPYIVLSLHLVREELRLNSLSEKCLKDIGYLLTQLSVWMGWSENWTQYYMLDFRGIDQGIKFLLILVLETPPNLLESLASLFTDKIIRYLTFAQLVEESDDVDALITPRTHYVLKLFEVLVSPNYGPNDVVDMMCEYGITICDLETYPPGIFIPLKEAILVCQENPAFEWNSKTLDLVGRKDLSMFLNMKTSFLNIGTTDDHVKDVNHILSNILEKNENVAAWDSQSEADRISTTKLIFDYDRRYYEITTLLHQTKVQTATLVADENLNEYDLILLQRALAATVALRTLTIPLGRAALFYGARKPLLTEKFPIPKFNLNTLIAPTMTNIILSDGAISDGLTEWGYFHNGVSSGLSISPESKGITGSWIIFNKPPDLNSQHAGFLLGLGLNGHLKKLEEWHIYNYLGPKHPLTSVGLLIGIAASIRGSMDNKLTKVLSVHAVALLPQGANDLNVPVIVQTAGLIGIGLLYLESQHRRMSEILLSQITSSVFQNDSEQIHEGYRLAAGIALGFVNLGKGDDLRGLNDTQVVDKLLSLAISMKDFQPAQELDKSCCGAIMALGFIYMKTGNHTIANKLKVPTAEQLLDYIRPDLLLLRCLAKNLILFQEIGSTVKWVESEIMLSALERFKHTDPLDSDQLAFYNILGGSCLSMAIRYASTHDLTARDSLLHYLDKLMLIAQKTPSNYDQKITLNTVTNIQNLLALCLSVVMAGSGDLEVFRRLRILHHATNQEVGYGYYMAINTALGFLFLGGGQYAFHNSNFAIACLVTSLYPIFPNDDGEYGIYLQALRHFWALSVNPRCLIIRDVNTQTSCKIPVTIKLKNGEVKESLSPCLLPNLNEILNIKTTSPEHFNVQIDFQLNSHYLEIFKKSLTIFVYKRHNYQLLKSSVGALLKNENKSLQVENGEIRIDPTIAKFVNLEVMKNVSNFEKHVIMFENDDSTKGEINSYDKTTSSGLSIFNIIDNKIELERMTTNPTSVENLWNLKLIFAFSDRLLNDELHFITLEFIEQLKHQILLVAS
ncbi:uncharacterized protein PRCAT00003774001 [Priceomyces carsonii]|uniref:uncharacterized protein n=1 Tax=Priceomyces carsonii TaxID=28549 RepID=UPI002ED89636|nr:unnamed protein product [Priceomyces carsonii]